MTKFQHLNGVPVLCPHVNLSVLANLENYVCKNSNETFGPRKGSTDYSQPEGLTDISTKLLVTILYVSVISVAVGGNAIVSYTVLCFQRVRNVTSYFIVNLAFSDMLMASVCIPFTFVSNLILSYWPFGSIMCPLVSYVQTVSVFVSAYTMVAVCIDRYIATVYPLRHRLCKRHAVLMIALVWLLSLSVSLPTALTSQVIVQNGIHLCQENWHQSMLKYHYSLVVMVLQYFFPVIFLSFAYGRVAFAIWFRNSPNKRDSGIRDKDNKQKMLKIMMIIVVLYAICWLPLHVVTLIGDQDPSVYDQPFMPILWISFHWLAMSNCCYNPFIYYWMSNKFKQGFKNVVRCCPCVKLTTDRCEKKVWRATIKSEVLSQKPYISLIPRHKFNSLSQSLSTNV